MIGGEKMEGLFFYGIAWVSWIVTTFLMKKNKMRLILSALLLLIIISSTTYKEVAGVNVYASSFILFFIGVIFVASAKKSKLLCCLYAVMIAMMYSVFHFVEIYDPIWIQVHRTILLGGILTVSSLLYSDYPSVSIGTLLMGTVQGEVVLAITLRKYGFHDHIGGLLHLEACFVASILLLSIHGMFLWLRTPKKTTHIYVRGMK
jgi:hypothetical protein